MKKLFSKEKYIEREEETKMKKIFSKEKYIENMGIEHYNELFRILGSDNWVDNCDGKEVINNQIANYGIEDDWCIESDEKEQLMIVPKKEYVDLLVTKGKYEELKLIIDSLLEHNEIKLF